MCRVRYEGLLLAVLLAAAILQVAVEALRTLNKCCAPNDHLYYNTDSGVFECETASQLAERAERVADGGDYGKSAAVAPLEGDDTDAEFGKFLVDLSEWSGDTFTQDDVVAGVIPSCAPDDREMLLDTRFYLRATPDAVTLHLSRRHEFPAHAWCVDRDDEGAFAAVVCPCADASQPCVRKCCHQEEAFHEERAECVASEVKPWTPTTQKGIAYYLLINKIPSNPTCKHRSTETFHRGQLMLQSDGSMKGIDDAGRNATYRPGRYCVDAASKGKQLVLFCNEEDKIEASGSIARGQSLVFYVTLFTLMGVMWVFDII